MVRGCGRPAAPHRWLIDVVARHGSPAPDGTFRLPDSQAALAAADGCTPSTIQARISVLEAQGLVISRRPLTVRLPVGLTVSSPTVRLDRHRPDRRTENDRTTPASAGVTAAHQPDGHLDHLLAANAALAAALVTGATSELIDAQQAIVTAIERHSRIRDATAADPRRFVADPRISEGQSVSHDLDLPKNNPTDSLTPPQDPRIRETVIDRASRDRGSAKTSSEEIDDLVQPLLAVADKCGLISITDRAGLHEALAQYHPPAIRHAVTQVTRMTKAGQIRSPFGWLITAARRGDPDLFTNPAAPASPGTATSPPAIEALDIAAEHALATAEPSELARIDAYVRNAPHNTPILSRILHHPDALHAARIAAWHALQEAS